MNRFHAVRHQSIVAATVLFAAGGLFAAPAARAEFPLPLPHEIHREVRAHVHDALRTLGRIPAEIHRSHVRNLEVFLGGNVYYAPHRHHHATYNFPVSIDGGVYYRPYTYCNNRLYGSYASRPQFWAGWGVPTQGHWCSSHRSYYPTGHSCFGRPSRSYGSYGYALTCPAIAAAPTVTTTAGIGASAGIAAIAATGTIVMTAPAGTTGAAAH